MSDSQAAIPLDHDRDAYDIDIDVRVIVANVEGVGESDATAHATSDYTSTRNADAGPNRFRLTTFDIKALAWLHGRTSNIATVGLVILPSLQISAAALISASEVLLGAVCAITALPGLLVGCFLVHAKSGCDREVDVIETVRQTRGRIERVCGHTLA